MNKALTSDAIVIANDSVLLVERKFDPFQGAWALPGGFLNPGEDPEEGARRELAEETGLHIDDIACVPLSFRQNDHRDPRRQTASFPFLFQLDSPRPVLANDDAEKAQWVPLHSIPSLAFDHGAMLCEAYAIYRGGLDSFIDGNEIVFFGGSFNPWHDGHDACLELARTYLGPRVPIVVIPDRNPRKKAQEMICFWKNFLDIQKQYAGPVYSGFFGMEEPNPTIRWVSELHKRHPSLRISLLIGEDSLSSFDSWIEAPRLKTILHRLIVAPRSGNHSRPEGVDIVMLPHHAFEHMSSSAIRTIH